ncbi:MAG: thioredoxin-disulfide reductase [Treponema sp.]|nr:thioredoxin-disulfide reductase [Treponema sp.]
MENKDIIIIGAGIAGISAAMYAARSGMKVSVIDEAGCGGQVLQIDDLENYPGVFPAVNGYDFMETAKKQAQAFGAEIIQTTITSLDRIDNNFKVVTPKGEFNSKALIIASGAEHKSLNVKGEKEFAGAGVSYCAVCDGPFFRKKIVTVIGGGDSAGTEALYLANLAEKVHLVHRRPEFRMVKSVSERILSNPKIEVHYNSIVKEIKGQDRVTSIELENTQTKEISEIETNGVFIFVGMNPRTSLVENLEKDAGGYIITDEKMGTKIPGLYVAGDVRSKPLRQIVTAASDGAIAAHSAAEFVKEN